ncbi:MAG: hypothetical protein BYD32DRAFT_297746 [Podila humilis]|nr:MAG: hypothetical protein BYD32DRAFT_297746 [Podila humilis]
MEKRERERHRYTHGCIRVRVDQTNSSKASPSSSAVLPSHAKQSAMCCDLTWPLLCATHSEGVPLTPLFSPLCSSLSFLSCFSFFLSSFLSSLLCPFFPIPPFSLNPSSIPHPHPHPHPSLHVLTSFVPSFFVIILIAHKSVPHHNEKKKRKKEKQFPYTFLCASLCVTFTRSISINLHAGHTNTRLHRPQ